jgi:hypothetical protein
MGIGITFGLKNIAREPSEVNGSPSGKLYVVLKCTGEPAKKTKSKTFSATLTTGNNYSSSERLTRCNLPENVQNKNDLSMLY